ncbi:hypothetical protein D3C86_1613880 [compost metagenome]
MASQYKFLSFLKNRLKQLQLSNQLPELESLNLSDTSAVEKIIYLNELGVIEFLRSRTKTGISNKGLASILSAITDENPETIRPHLNRLQTDKDNCNPKHPYATQKTVDRVKKQLTDLGF